MECETLLQYKWRMDLICRRVGQWRQPAPSSSSSRSNTVAAVQHIWTRCCVVWLLDAASKARVQKFAPGHRIQRSDWPIIGNISWLMFVICGTKQKKSAQRTTSCACMYCCGRCRSKLDAIERETRLSGGMFATLYIAYVGVMWCDGRDRQPTTKGEFACCVCVCVSCVWLSQSDACM